MTDHHVISWDEWNESVRRDLYWCAEELRAGTVQGICCKSSIQGLARA